MKRYVILLLCVTILISAFSGCKAIEKSDADNGSVTKNTGENDLKDKNTKNKEESISTHKSSSLVEANNRFAWKIFKELNMEDKGKNVFISPLSISSMLSMALNGAENSTREAMLGALGYEGITSKEINEGYKYLFERLESLDDKTKLNISNSIWMRDGFAAEKDFIDINREAFSAEVESLDFNKRESVDVINNWIDKATEHLIPKMIDPPIHIDVIMYLINAIYFKGQWTTPFNPDRTFDGQFHSLNGRDQDISMMSRNGKVDFVDSDKYKAIRLPYGEGKTSMYCILPEKGQDIDEWSAEMTEDTWNEIQQGLKPVNDISIQIPKFKMEYGSKSLNYTLSLLGMGEALTPTADFSGISKSQNVYISSILHKAVIEVNEEGSEAAAVTIGEIRTTSVSKPVTFIADRPFIFIIADDEDGSILFLGKLISVEQ